MRFSINFFTSIGLGGLTDGMRAELAAAKQAQLARQQAEAIAAAEREAASSSSSDSDSSSSSDSDSSDSDSSSDSSDSRCGNCWDGIYLSEFMNPASFGRDNISFLRPFPSGSATTDALLFLERWEVLSGFSCECSLLLAVVPPLLGRPPGRRGVACLFALTVHRSADNRHCKLPFQLTTCSPVSVATRHRHRPPATTLATSRFRRLRHCQSRRRHRCLCPGRRLPPMESIATMAAGTVNCVSTSRR
jgi:hypothetical protein